MLDTSTFLVRAIGIKIWLQQILRNWKTMCAVADRVDFPGGFRPLPLKVQVDGNGFDAYSGSSLAMTWYTLPLFFFSEVLRLYPTWAHEHVSSAGPGSLRTVARYHTDRDGPCDNHRRSLTQARTIWSARPASGLPSDIVNVAPEARHEIHSDEHPEPGRADERASNDYLHG